MTARRVKQSAPLALICGEDEFAVKQRAKELYQGWTQEVGGLDHEILDASVANGGEALKVLARLREALQTLPFFGTAKVIWLKNCNFLADERWATADVTEQLVGLAQELKEFAWENVRLLVSAGKVDKRKVFYKALDKLGTVEVFAGWSLDDRDWETQVETWARQAVQARDKEISEPALAELIERVGPHARQLENEIEKVSLYIGERKQIDLPDVRAVCAHTKNARAFALGDALGDRDLPELLKCLDEELWAVKLDPKKSEIGLLYGLISKVRAMLFLKEMLQQGWVTPEKDFFRFKTQLERVPREQLPEDKRFNPLSLNPYVLFKAVPQANRYTREELARAMELLFRCNQRMVTSSSDDALVLQQTLVAIAGGRSESPPADQHAKEPFEP
ncbi:DNA polymerase III delta [Verrucomicrobia bacterium]|nr:DNA polymerase III delta [Verrucomicrobiota bacterium]